MKIWSVVIGLLTTAYLTFPCNNFALAQEADSETDNLFITQYQSSLDHKPVFGLFDIGNKPSIRLLNEAVKGGKLQFTLSGRYYRFPLSRPFAVVAEFEDVTGRAFQTSKKIYFTPAIEAKTPVWFTGLEETAGYYGNQSVEIPVPEGATIINLMADDTEEGSPSPNQLLGYVSHIRILKK